ncbi:MAG: PilZ domain-containing protein [Treponema sp.]|nr:PilZ domain-containing protein [Treponema sp.]
MAGNDNLNTLGRKIFFLHPSALIQNQIVAELAQEEYEVYILRDESKLRHILGKYPDSIVFANISDGMKESAWEAWIRGIMGNQETSQVDVGVLSSTQDDTLREKYTEQLKVSCGYTVVKSDILSAIRQVTANLTNVNAKGRRKYIRALMDGETVTTVNIPVDGNFVNGTIKDISVVGFSCTFDEDPQLTKNRLFADIQIRLQTQLLKVEGIAFGSRQDGSSKVYVILFTQRIDPDVRTRIRKYIQTTLQNRMDHEFR